MSETDLRQPVPWEVSLVRGDDEEYVNAEVSAVTEDDAMGAEQSSVRRRLADLAAEGRLERVHGLGPNGPRQGLLPAD